MKAVLTYKKCHNLDAQPSRGAGRRGDDEQTIGKQTPQSKPYGIKVYKITFGNKECITDRNGSPGFIETFHKQK